MPVDVLVLGSGVAGLSAALRAARAGLSVLVLTKDEIRSSATWYAQGGVAAALESKGDSPELHLADTVSAGAELCDVDAVRVLVTEGPDRVRELIGMGAQFDRVNEDRRLAFSREGGHTVARIVHAGGDATGAEIERALIDALASSTAEVRERCFAVDLLVERGRAAGVRTASSDGALGGEVRARHTVVATGGAGQCFAVTTNPLVSTGDGIAMALRAGVAVADLEFMQFHPTALHHPLIPRPLLSEALRGEGAILRDEQGLAFMAAEHPLADLAPRDVVARAIAARLNERGLDHLWLDATSIADIATRFPTITRACRAIGLEPAEDWLPVAPAAHYLSGGICTDLDGASTLRGLWACGEAACCGVHGANRLASNSLLDGLVFASRTVEAIVGGKDAPEESGVLRGIPTSSAYGAATIPEPAGRSVREDVQQVMTRDAGVLRDRTSLARAATALSVLDPAGWEVRNLVAVGSALVHAALAREESRGTHTRVDHPERSDTFAGRFVFTSAPEPIFVPLPVAARA